MYLPSTAFAVLYLSTLGQRFCSHVGFSSARFSTLYSCICILCYILNQIQKKNGEQKVHGSDQSMKLCVSISYGNTKPCQLIRAVII